MPNTDFIAKLLDIKDLIVENLEIFTSEIHIYFKLERRDCVCPNCGAITNKIHDYRSTIIKDSPIQGKKCFLHYKNVVTIAKAARNISRNLLPYYRNTVELPIVCVTFPYINLETLKMLLPLLKKLVFLHPLFLED